MIFHYAGRRRGTLSVVDIGREQGRRLSLTPTVIDDANVRADVAGKEVLAPFRAPLAQRFMAAQSGTYKRHRPLFNEQVGYAIGFAVIDPPREFNDQA